MTTSYRVSPNYLLFGEGDIFLTPGDPLTQNISTTKGKGNIVGQNIGTAIGNITLEECKRERDGLQKENELLKEQLAMKDNMLDMKDGLIAAKEELLMLLRSKYNRPN